MPHKCTNCARNFEDGSTKMLSGCPDCGGTTFQYLPDGGTVMDAPSSATPPERPEVPGSAVAETVGRATTKVRDFVSETPNSGGVSEHPTDDAEVTVAAANETEDDSTGNIVHDSVENVAQSSARTEMVTPEELSDARGSTGIAVGSTGSEGRSTRSGRSSTRSEGRSTGSGRSSIGNEGRSTGNGGGDHESGSGSTAPAETCVPRSETRVPRSEGRVVDTPSGESPDISELREELNDQFEGIRILDPGQYELNLMELFEREETIIALRENGRYVIDPPESWRGD